MAYEAMGLIINKKTFITVTIFTSSVTSEQFGGFLKSHDVHFDLCRCMVVTTLHHTRSLSGCFPSVFLSDLLSFWPSLTGLMSWKTAPEHACEFVCTDPTQSELICHKHTHFMISREYRNCLCTHIRLWWGIAMTRGLRIAKPLKEAFFLNHINTYNTHVLVSLQFLNELNWLKPPLKWSPVISFWFIGKSPSFLGPRVLLSQHLLFW